MVAMFRQPSEGEQMVFSNASIRTAYRRLPASTSANREPEKGDLIPL